MDGSSYILTMSRLTTTIDQSFLIIKIHVHVTMCENNLQVLCEVPESYEAYKKQQHRWHSGPMQLFRLCLGAILTSKVALQLFSPSKITPSVKKLFQDDIYFFLYFQRILSTNKFQKHYLHFLNPYWFGIIENR